MSARAPSGGAPNDAFLAKQHVLFALRNAKYLPTPYQAEDNNRMTLAYFCLAALAILPSSVVSTADPLLSALQIMLKPTQRQGLVEWVYEQQLPSGGFRGSDSLAAASSSLDNPHIIQSYTALLILGLLDDDYSRLDREGLVRFIGACQNEDGSFSQFPGSLEPGDPRSTYSAFAVASMLDDWSSINVDRALDFLNSCRRYEGGFSQRPGLEANAGPTYCAIASFSLALRLSSLSCPEQLLRWLVSRQVRPLPRPPRSESSDSEDEDGAPEERRPEDSAGFQGRANKPTDACYSFWNTAALSLLLPTISPHLSLPSLLDPALDRTWLLDCQHRQFGGLAREPGALPDVMHTYLSLAALSLGDDGGAALGMRELDPAWNVPREVAARMRERLRRREV
ncbi:geranylgeranyl transferase type-1 subunit beta [Rhodotorula kratochvilovae]